MSYLLRIWENPTSLPLPESIDAATKLLDGMDTSRAVQENPKFIELAQRLTKRYPIPDEWPAEAESDEDEVPLDEVAWSDWPVTGKTDSAIWNLGLNGGLLDKVRPFVMQEATALGLCVMDEQAGEAWLPSGTVLCLPGRKPAPVVETRDDDDPPHTKEVLAQVYQHLLPLMTERGFKGHKRSLTFVRGFAGGWHELSVRSSVDYWPVCANFDVFVRARFHAISDLVAAASDPDRPAEDVADTATLLCHQRQWLQGGEPLVTGHNKYYDIHKPTDIDMAVDHLCAQLRERMLPALDACTTLEAFEQALNPPPGEQTFFNGYLGGTENMIAAYLVRSPRLEELCAEYDPRPRYHLGRRPNRRVEACVDYIRSHPLPA